MLPFIDSLNYYFGEVFYCVPKGFKVPPSYKDRTAYYERLFYLRPNTEEEYEATAAFPNVCIEKAHQYSIYGKHRWKGYLLKGDDTFILHKKPIFSNRFDQMWIRKKFEIYDTKTRCHSEEQNLSATNCNGSVWDTWYQEKQIQGSQSVLNYLRMSRNIVLNKCASNLEKKLTTKTSLYYQQRGTDFVYIPSRFIKKFIVLMRPFIKHQISFETALPNVIECLRGESNSTLLDVVGINEIGQVRDKMIEDPHQSLIKAFNDNTTFLHPIKLARMVQQGLVFNSHVQLSERAEKRALFNQAPKALQRTYCNDMLPYILMSS